MTAREEASRQARQPRKDRKERNGRTLTAAHWPAPRNFVRGRLRKAECVFDDYFSANGSDLMF